MTNREAIIENYIIGYNGFDIERMVENFHEEVVFENISEGKVTLSLAGLQAFKEQAQHAISYFSSRKQVIKSFDHRENQTSVTLDYSAILAIDLPNGMNKGSKLELQGISIFHFSGDKIIKLVDVT
jgi:hypothetical protein